MESCSRDYVSDREVAVGAEMWNRTFCHESGSPIVSRELAATPDLTRAEAPVAERFWLLETLNPPTGYAFPKA
jgi:hypothetical protein